MRMVRPPGMGWSGQSGIDAVQQGDLFGIAPAYDDHLMDAPGIRDTGAAGPAFTQTKE